MSFKIIADSGCDLTQELKKEMGIETVPLSMNLGGSVYVDDEKLDVERFMKEMHEHKELPRSACPSPYDYMSRCEKGKTNFIVTLSSKLSGSYDSAVIAKDMLAEQGIDAHVFDSKSAAAGQLLIVTKLRELINNGHNRPEVIKKLEDFIKGMKTFFVLESLENLLKNGRMNKVTGVIAGVLNIRLIMMGNENGEIMLHSKARGSQNAISKLAETIGEKCKDTTDRILAIAHCNSPFIDTLKNIVKEKYNFKDIIVVPTHGLTGMYANYGGIIIAF